MPARSVVALLGLDQFVDGGIDWSLPDDLTDPGGVFYPPNNDVEMPRADQSKLILQEWFFPSGDPKGFKQRFMNSGAETS